MLDCVNSHTPLPIQATATAAAASHTLDSQFDSQIQIPKYSLAILLSLLPLTVDFDLIFYTFSLHQTLVVGVICDNACHVEELDIIKYTPALPLAHHICCDAFGLDLPCLLEKHIRIIIVPIDMCCATLRPIFDGYNMCFDHTALHRSIYIYSTGSLYYFPIGTYLYLYSVVDLFICTFSCSTRPIQHVKFVPGEMTFRLQ